MRPRIAGALCVEVLRGRLQPAQRPATQYTLLASLLSSESECSMCGEGSQGTHLFKAPRPQQLSALGPAAVA